MAGLFGTDWLTGDVLGAGFGLVAGLSSGGNESKSSTTLDPRIAQYLYGEDGKSGTLADANSIYQQQIANGGLNDLQRQGLDMQRQYLTSPQYMQGAQSMYNTGAGLLAGGVAGNPFNRGQGGVQGGGMASNPFQFAQSPALQSYAPQRPTAPTAQQRVQAQQPGLAPGQGGQGGRNTLSQSTYQPSERQGGGGGGGTPGGQGNSNSMTNTALGLMSMGTNPVARFLSPVPSLVARTVGGAMADRQIDARSAAANKLEASQPMMNLGMGTVSDDSGNVRTYSTPESIAAADAAMFGFWDNDTPDASGQNMGAGAGLYGLRSGSGGNLGSMGGGRGVSGTASGGLSGGFQGGGGLGLRGSW